MPIIAFSRTKGFLIGQSVEEVACRYQEMGAILGACFAVEFTAVHPNELKELIEELIKTHDTTTEDKARKAVFEVFDDLSPYEVTIAVRGPRPVPYKPKRQDAFKYERDLSRDELCTHDNGKSPLEVKSKEEILQLLRRGQLNHGQIRMVFLNSENLKLSAAENEEVSRACSTKTPTMCYQCGLTKNNCSCERGWW